MFMDDVMEEEEIAVIDMIFFDWFAVLFHHIKDEGGEPQSRL